MPKGGVVAVTLAHQADELLVTVADGGTGVAQEHLERASRRSSPPSRAARPRPLDRAAQSRRVGGRIEVDSPIPEPERPPKATGPGTRFRVYWPLAGAAVAPTVT